MGCTSAKPKRTTSIEDVAPKQQPVNASQVPDKNGQVNKAAPSGDDKILREKPSGAIEIPGAHKSFMAPDGIPFIDEDIESEVEDVQAAAVVGANDSRGAKHGSPDQNKNVAIVANKQAKLSSPAANPASAATATTAAVVVPEKRSSSALPETATAGGDAATRVVVNAGYRDDDDEEKEEEHRKEVVTASESTVVSEIKMQEIHITTTNNQHETTEVITRTVVTDGKPQTDEEIAAATKIQAGIRGYLDRQKVKAIRANKQHPTENGDDKHADDDDDDHTQHHSGPKVTVTEHTVVVEERHEERHPDDLHDPKLDAAATRIQANYKGYRTRKEIKTSTHPPK